MAGPGLYVGRTKLVRPVTGRQSFVVAPRCRRRGPGGLARAGRYPRAQKKSNPTCANPRSCHLAADGHGARRDPKTEKPGRFGPGFVSISVGQLSSSGLTGFTGFTGLTGLSRVTGFSSTSSPAGGGGVVYGLVRGGLLLPVGGLVVVAQGLVGGDDVLVGRHVLRVQLDRLLQRRDRALEILHLELGEPEFPPGVRVLRVHLDRRPGVLGGLLVVLQLV